MEIELYNTLTRQKEALAPRNKGEVSMYNCGPTVYDVPHIGNFRTFLLNDILRRAFEYDGYAVDQAMNITDVDDKTIRRSREEKVPLKELTAKYEKLFFEGMEAMNIEKPRKILRATEHIGSMISLIEKLIEKGVAYAADDGVYVSISRVKEYGALAHLDLSQASEERITNDEYDKESPRDFAVWKFKAPGADESEPSWPAPFGEGRPGWHIECSAMAMEALGPTIDVHTGGADLIFPHHTNEIAQSESANGVRFVRMWVHGGFMNVSDEKMAKSKGNFLKLGDLEAASISPIAYRYWLLTAHYRSPVNFTFAAVKAAQNALIRLMAAIGGYPEGGTTVGSYRERFTAAINDDLDMPKAVALAWELLKDPVIPDADKRATLIDFDRVFGLKLDSVPRMAADEATPAEIQALADAREDARKAKDWNKADALRKEIEARGYSVSDTPEGIRIRRSV